METASHLQRVSCYSALLAERFGLDADLVRPAARLHDIGMASVPDDIVLKPGPLTPEERREMQDHAELGNAMLEGADDDLLDVAAQIACSHHERFDGEGYPCGWVGERIPLVGRIVAVADTFDALTTYRAYRPAVSFEEAAEVLRSERGRQFDPEVVDVFLEALEEVHAIRERFAPGGEPFRGVRAGEEEPETQVTLRAAADALAISPSRLRRWADEGRTPTVRTSGGHRRFPLQAVRRLAAERGVRPSVRPVEPPDVPLPQLADELRAHGRALVGAAAAVLYRDGPEGWFAADTAVRDLREWLKQMIESSSTGRYTGAIHATEVLMRRAHLHAATLLERHAFLERVGQVVVRSLVRDGAGRTVIADTRRLFASLQQSLLDAA
jgi:putative nucleotidyltransferase with HDIG domain/excisionase family DNA binding protein